MSLRPAKKPARPKRTGVFMDPAYVSRIETEAIRLRAEVQTLKVENAELTAANRLINSRLGRQVSQCEQRTTLDQALGKVRDAIAEFQNDYPPGSIRL